jgi:Cu/Ag efflux pump CusA
MKQIPGVIDASALEETKEFHRSRSDKLIAANVSVSQVMNVVASSNASVGANYLNSVSKL